MWIVVCDYDASKHSSTTCSEVDVGELTSDGNIECWPEFTRGRGGGGYMHGRRRRNIDLRIPTMPGRSMLGFHRRGSHCLHQARSSVRCLAASRMKGELHRTKNRLWRGEGGAAFVIDPSIRQGEGKVRVTMTIKGERDGQRNTTK